MQSVLVLGDCHAAWPWLGAALSVLQPDICLVAGDFGWWPKLLPLPHTVLPPVLLERTELHFLDGNHEDHPALRRAAPRGCFEPVELAPRIIYHPRGSVMRLPDGRTVFFAGGGKSVDRAFRTEGRDWFAEEVLVREDLPSELPRADVVISHTLPAAFGVKKFLGKRLPPERFDVSPDPGCAVLDAVLEACRPALWLGGHFHRELAGEYTHADGRRTVWRALDELSGWYYHAHSPCAFWLCGGPPPGGAVGFPGGERAPVSHDRDGLYVALPEDNVPPRWRDAVNRFCAGRACPVMTHPDGSSFVGFWLQDIFGFLEFWWRQRAGQDGVRA